MTIPHHFFAEHSWPGPERLVELARLRQGFVRDEGSSGVWYASGQDEWARAQPDSIPDGTLRVAWLAVNRDECDTEILISEVEYLQALHAHLSGVGLSRLAEQVGALLRSV